MKWALVFHRLNFAFLLLLGLLGSFSSTHISQDLDQISQFPSSDFWLGTDSLGRSLGWLLLNGYWNSVGLAITAFVISLILGTGIGFVVGYWQGWLDDLVMRFVEILSALPSLVLITVFVLFFEGLVTDFISAERASWWALALGLGLTHWLGIFRWVRSLVRQEMKKTYIEGARAVGASPVWVMRRHVWSNLKVTWMQSLILFFPSFLVFESFLSFLGFGFQAPSVSLGILLNDGWKVVLARPWQMLIPGFVLFWVSYSFHRLAAIQKWGSEVL